MPAFDLKTVLGPFTGPIADAAVAELTANKDAVIAALKAAEVKVIDVVADDVVNAIDHSVNGVFAAAIKKPLENAVRSLESQILAQLGGEDEALFALVLAYAKKGALALGG